MKVVCKLIFCDVAGVFTQLNRCPAAVNGDLRKLGRECQQRQLLAFLTSHFPFSFSFVERVRFFIILREGV